VNLLEAFAHPSILQYTFRTQMRTLFLIVTLACVQFGCGHDNPTLVRGNLNDAVKRHASIYERIMEWGAPSGKETLTDGQLVYTWKLPWSEEQILPDGTAYPIQHGCTVVITTSSDNAIQSYKTDDC
jgi:hypothetical protein